MAPTLEILGPELLDEEASLRSGTEKREESDATEATSFSEDKTLNSLDLDTEESERPPAGKKLSDGQVTMETRTMWMRVTLTLLMFSAFLTSSGMLDGLRGPTMIDLAKYFGTKIKYISNIITLGGSAGSITGATFAGFFLDRFERYTTVYLSIAAVGAGLSTAVYTATKNLYVFGGAVVSFGFFAGSITTAGNVLCLSLWRGHRLSPAMMQTIHFAYSLGSSVAPMLAKPFLGHETGGCEAEEEILTRTEDSEVHMDTLFPIAGGICVMLAVMFFPAVIWDVILMRNKTTDIKVEANLNPKAKISISKRISKKIEAYKSGAAAMPRREMFFVAIMFTFFFAQVGIEHMVGLFLSPFACRSSLNLNTKTGAEITLGFYSTFALGRLLAIFVSTRVRPFKIIAFSFLICLASATVLAAAADTSEVWLWAGSISAGLGLAATYATTFAWVEEHMTVTAGIGGLLTVAGSLGPDVMPLLVGNYIQESPMVMMYLYVAMVVMCIALFGSAALIARGIKRRPMEGQSCSSEYA